MKLDRPIWEQYVAFLVGVTQGDLGDSLWKKQPVTRVLADRIQPTLFLVFYALVMTVVLTLPLAGWAALNKGRWPDQVVRVFTVLSLAMPAYWIGLMLLQILRGEAEGLPGLRLGGGVRRAPARALPARPGADDGDRLADHPQPAQRHPGDDGAGFRAHGPRQGASGRRGSSPATCCATRRCRR